MATTDEGETGTLPFGREPIEDPFLDSRKHLPNGEDVLDWEVYRLIGQAQSREYCCALEAQAEQAGVPVLPEVLGGGKFSVRARGVEGHYGRFRNLPALPGAPRQEPDRTHPLYKPTPRERAARDEAAAHQQAQQDAALKAADQAAAAHEALNVVRERAPHLFEQIVTIVRGGEVPPPAARPAASGVDPLLLQLLHKQDARMDRLEAALLQRPAAGGGPSDRLLEVLLTKAFAEPAKGPSDSVVEALINKALQPAQPSKAWEAVQAIVLGLAPAVGAGVVTWMELKADTAQSRVMAEGFKEAAETVRDMMADFWPDRFGYEDEPAGGSPPPAQIATGEGQ